MNPETIILIPSYNGVTLLNSCLSSLTKQSYQNFKVVVVDDASTDDTVIHLQVHFPKVDVVALPRNGGFAKAVNSGLQYAIQKYNPEFIAILNNDTTVDSQWLGSLVKRMNTDARIAAVTSNMLFYDHPEIINSQGGTIDWNGDGYDINFGIPRKRGKKESSEVIGACFGAALVRAKVLQKVGFLDEMFGAYFEDLDWSWRAHLYGYHVLFEPEAIVYHQHSASYNKMPYKKLYFCKRNALRAALKNYERENLPRSVMYILIGYWFAMVGYFQTSRHRLPFFQKLGSMSIPFLALFWNVIHLPSTLQSRRKIQQERTVHDEKITQLAQQNFTSVGEWLRHLKQKLPMSRRVIQNNTAKTAALFQKMRQRAVHKVFLPIVEKTKHTVMPSFHHALSGGALLEESLLLINDETMRAYLQTVFANLPFRLFEISKEDFVKNESALVIDACIFFFQLPLYRDRKDFQEVLNKIQVSAQRLNQAHINWEEVITFAQKMNAPSQLYGYIRLMLMSDNKLTVPPEVIQIIQHQGSRVQNILIDRFEYKKLERGRIPFSLKLYSQMYIEQGLLKYLTTRAHALSHTRSDIRPVKNSTHIPITKETPISHGVNIFGFFDSESGVGEAARTITRAVVQKGIPCALVNSQRCPHRKKENEFSKKFSTRNPYKVNIITFYGDVFEDELHAFGEQRFQNKYNIAYWAWELSQLPDTWAALLKNVNEVWTPSSFSAQAITQAKKEIPVTIIPHAITIRKSPYPRKRFKLPDNTFLFLFMFDFYSIFERKNPLAIIRAFKNAFRSDEHVALVIKSSNHAIDPENFAKLQKESEAHNIFILNDYLSREEVSSLLNVCDAYVSLHRSEGFGLTIAEAMALGKPVIATNYSGNTDFMNEENSFPIPYKLVELQKDYGPYKKGNIWADPNEEAAAQAMRMVYSYSEIAARKGGKARSDIVAKLSPAAVADAITDRLTHIKTHIK